MRFRKLLVFVSIVLLVSVFFSGCGRSLSIEQTVLTESEAAFAKAVGSTQIARLRINGKVEANTEIAWKIDHYYRGELQDSFFSGNVVTLKESKNTQLIFSIGRGETEKTEIWNFSTGGAFYQQSVAVPDGVSIFSINVTEKVGISKDEYVPVVVITRSGSGIRGSAYDILKGDYGSLKDEDHVYVLKLKISKQ